MNVKNFIGFVELRTKLASVLPFIFGCLYALYDKENFNFNFLTATTMFISLIFIDMTTTAINNYMDYTKSDIDIYKNTENIIGINNISLGIARKTIYIMLTIAIVSGIYLVVRTNIIVLFVGMVAFGIGVFYTYGPTPISRTPYGEVISGVTMGLGIVFLALHIHGINDIISIFINAHNISIGIDYYMVTTIVIISMPFTLAIANVMLANNICDLETDVKNNRFLLPYYIGKNNAIKIFEANYILAYIFIIISVVLGIMPTSTLLTLLTYVVVRKNIKLFKLKQIKKETFVVSVKNLLLISVVYNASLILGIIVSNISIG